VAEGRPSGAQCSPGAREAGLPACESGPVNRLRFVVAELSVWVRERRTGPGERPVRREDV